MFVLMKSWLGIDSSRKTVIVFDWLHTGEFIILQWIVPKPWAHRWLWLHPVGHKSKQKDLKVGNSLVEQRSREIKEGGR